MYARPMVVVVQLRFCLGEYCSVMGHLRVISPVGLELCARFLQHLPQARVYHPCAERARHRCGRCSVSVRPCPQCRRCRLAGGRRRPAPTPIQQRRGGGGGTSAAAPRVGGDGHRRPRRRRATRSGGGAVCAKGGCRVRHPRRCGHCRRCRPGGATAGRCHGGGGGGGGSRRRRAPHPPPPSGGTLRRGAARGATAPRRAAGRSRVGAPRRGGGRNDDARPAPGLVRQRRAAARHGSGGGGGAPACAWPTPQREGGHARGGCPPRCRRRGGAAGRVVAVARRGASRGRPSRPERTAGAPRRPSPTHKLYAAAATMDGLGRPHQTQIRAPSGRRLEPIGLGAPRTRRGAPR